MDGRCDGRSRARKRPVNLKQQLVIGSWNVRGFRNKETEVLESLKSRNVQICGLQETKTGKDEYESGDYNIFLFDRDNPQYGLGFAVSRGLKVLDCNRVSHRICTLTIQKEEKWKTTRTGECSHKIYQVEKQKTKLSIINCYAPHMGLTMKDPLLGKEFYAELVKNYKSFAGQDVIITGDFNAKLGCKDFIGGSGIA